MPSRSTFPLPARLILVMVLFAGVAVGQNVSTVYNFSGLDGEKPTSQILAQGRDGLLYGTTMMGGANGYGTIFKLNPRTWFLYTVYDFGPQGTWPEQGLTLATDGNFYGTASSGGSYNQGVLFRFSPGGVYTVLHEFTGGSDGNYPFSPPIETENGVLYGTSGGIQGSNKLVSALYKFVISTGAFSTVYTVTPYGNVWDPPAQISSGDFYLATTFISPTGCGSILRVTPAGVLKSTYTFSSCAAKQGASPGSLIAAADGNVYGSASEGGINWVGGGTIFKDNPKTGIVSVVHAFGSISNDGLGGSGLIQASDGNFYGVTQGGTTTQSEDGTLFQLVPGGAYTVFYDFPIGVSEPTEPGVPGQYTSGAFYGVTYFGGTSTKGSIYTLDMGLSPYVALVCYRGKIGQTVQILGQGLTGATGVTINGTTVTSFKVASDSLMTAVIPAGATSGPVVVTTATGTLTSNKNLQVVP